MVLVVRPWFQTSFNFDFEKEPILSFLDLGVNFKVFVRDNTSCLRHSFNQIVVLT
jgi:hypothetical protein